jgi:hypothetical protein
MSTFKEDQQRMYEHNKTLREAEALEASHKFLMEAHPETQPLFLRMQLVHIAEAISLQRPVSQDRYDEATWTYIRSLPSAQEWEYYLTGG